MAAQIFLGALLALVLSACAGPAARVPAGVAASPAFQVGRDTFAFPNVVRAERSGAPDAFANYCLVMVAAASQFYRFARFAPEQPRVSALEYTRLVREILAIGAWRPPRFPADRVVIPGYAGLFALSAEESEAVKAAFDPALPSLIHWRTWRVGAAQSPAHQTRLARELREEVDARRPAPLMITNFPHRDLLNHALLVYDYHPRGERTEFLAYDPNDPANPLGLHFDPTTRAFWVAPLSYSPPGRVRAFRLYGSPWL